LSPGVTVEPAGEIRFSTVFTPNKDGEEELTELPEGGTKIDQFFFPPIREKVIDYKLQIFNRLGVLIFQSGDINIPWNGYYKGQLCSQGGELAAEIIVLLLLGQDERSGLGRPRQPSRFSNPGRRCAHHRRSLPVMQPGIDQPSRGQQRRCSR
jgi:hypothetical protein